MKKEANLILIFLFAIISTYSSCKKNGSGSDPTVPNSITGEYWVTQSNGTTLLQKQNDVLQFLTTSNANPTIEVDSTQSYQSIDGFGFTLTGGSAQLINTMGATEKANLLNELFSSNGIGISYLRLSIGASDLSPAVFSYDDMPAGQTDPTLANFSLSEDLTHLVPLLQQILTINPNIKLMGSPWSPPVWMKDNGSSIGGSLLPQYYSVYANYFVKYIQAMKVRNINIDAVTLQNEPQHGGNNPSMLMTAAQQAEFVRNHLGPAFQAANINTKIIVWDHNCDNPGYPVTVLNDAAAKPFIDGSAFHLYAGDISALSSVRTAHPDKNLYFTEQWTSSTGDFGGDLRWHIKNVIVGSMRNWSRNALEWNLANDAAYGPHTPGGCTQCKGALTISGSSVNKNVAYYIIAHASKFVPTGSVRINSSTLTNLPNVAFKTTAGKKVLIVLNDTSNPYNFNIKYKGRWASTTLASGAVATYIW